MQELTKNEIEQVSGGHAKSSGQVAAECIVATAAFVAAGATGVGAILAIGGLIAANWDMR
ncbi:hypothetical protein [Shewanella waksmanii]|uniref:hypothetical protein n=1 Tax=Shewanella waksmanii TaxID=213783 RepID=UPI003736FBBC